MLSSFNSKLKTQNSKLLKCPTLLKGFSLLPSAFYLVKTLME